MTYEEYLKKQEALTREGQAYQRKYREELNEIDETHDYNLHNENLRWKMDKRKANSAYLKQIQELGQKKRALRISFQLEQSQTNVHEDDRTAIH